MRTTLRIIQIPLPGLLCILLEMTSAAAPRDVQMRSVDFEMQVLELFNFGTTTQSITGWRFCTHDEDQALFYSSSGGLSGRSIDPGEALFIHFANDASEPNELNVSQLGNPLTAFATPFDQGPAYSIGLYVNGAFSVGSQMADYIQWSIDGAHNTTADERADEAVTGGVWTAVDAWIPVTSTTKRILLSDLTGGILHSPENYNVLEDIVFGDISGDGSVGLEDYELWKVSFSTGDVSADLNNDGSVNAADYTLWRDIFSNVTPEVSLLRAVPEPSTIVALIVAGAVLGSRHRQRRGCRSSSRRPTYIALAIDAVE